MVACEGCGVSVGKKVKGLCADCGKTSTRIRKQVSRRAYHNREQMPPLLRLGSVNVRTIPMSECNVCEVMYKPKVSDRTTCCSRKCGHMWSRFKTRALLNGGRVWVRKVINKPKPLVFADHPPEPKVCACGNRFYAKRLFQKSCSNQCIAERKRKSMRSARSRRKAMERRATVIGVSVDPYDVFDRDDWTCQMCGCETPKRERGSINDNAPELDHIYPLSKGGEHSMRNLQCLCRSCNQNKSDDVIEGLGYAVQAGVGHSCHTSEKRPV